MPKVTFVKSARKDNKICKKGESYYWWKFRFGGKRLSLTYPRPSQLTQSSYLGSVYDLIDIVNDYGIEDGEEGVIEALTSEVIDSITDIRDECQGSLDNMPEQLQYAPTGELLQERIDACDAAESELDSIEEPDQWQEIRDAQNEYDQWVADEPDSNGSEKAENLHSDWEEAEPDEVDDFEDFDTSPITEAIDNMLI